MDATYLPPQKNGAYWITPFHLAVVLLAWASPVFFRWPLIIAGIGLFYLQILIFGKCLLTRWQFRTKERQANFYYFLLVKLGFRPSLATVRLVAGGIVPWLVFGLALLLQLGFQLRPLII